jgi:hypothetical protein
VGHHEKRISVNEFVSLMEINYPKISRSEAEMSDNVGAMFMAQNPLSGIRTCRIDTRYHYVRENSEEGIMIIEFVKSNENHSCFHFNLGDLRQAHDEIPGSIY